MHLSRPFPLPEERNPKIFVSSGTLQLLLRMTAKEPENRFDSWNELMKALDYAASSRPPGARGNPAASPVGTIKSTLLLKSRIKP